MRGTAKLPWGLCLALIVVLGCGPERRATPPRWWYNAHRDDAEYVYEKGSASGAATEAAARQKACENALSLMAKRLCAQVSTVGSRVRLSARYAFTDVTIKAEGAQSLDGKWYAWLLVRYPQAERRKVIERLKEQLKNVQQVAAVAEKVPRDFRIAVTTSGGKTAYRQGEKVVLEVKPSKSCYLAVFVHQPDGVTRLLFPNRWERNTFVPAGRTVRIPDKTYHGFEIAVTPPYGDEVVQVIACTRKADLYRRIDRTVARLRPREAFGIMSRGLVAQAVGASVGADAGADTKWGEATMMISTYPARRAPERVADTEGGD